MTPSLVWPIALTLSLCGAGLWSHVSGRPSPAACPFRVRGRRILMGDSGARTWRSLWMAHAVERQRGRGPWFGHGVLVLGPVPSPPSERLFVSRETTRSLWTDGSSRADMSMRRIGLLGSASSTALWIAYFGMGGNLEAPEHGRRRGRQRPRPAPPYPDRPGLPRAADAGRRSLCSPARGPDLERTSEAQWTSPRGY